MGIDAAFFERRISQAVERRKRLFPKADAFRAVHGEADLLPGLFADRYGDSRPGRSTVLLDRVATGLLALSALLAAVAPETFVGVYFGYSILCFLAGSVLFFLAMLRAAHRSRTDAIGIGGLFFMAGTAPTWARRQLLGLLGAQVVISVVAASVRPFTPLAFGTLAPLLGLGVCGWWTARFGIFGPRA